MHKAKSYWSIEHGFEATDSVENALGGLLKPMYSSSLAIMIPPYMKIRLKWNFLAH